MSFRFPYLTLATTRPIISLAGRFSRPRPIIPLIVFNGITGVMHRVRAMVDTGADDAVFHDDVARVLGIDLSNATTRQAQGVSGAPILLRYSEVCLQLMSPTHEVLEWEAMVAFAPRTGSLPLLGFAGFLQFFDTTFFGESEEVELVPNGLLPAKAPTVHIP